MTVLFGVDIANILNNAIGDQLLSGTLQKRERIFRRSDSLTSGTADYTITNSSSFNGFVNQWAANVMEGKTLVRTYGKTVSILGGSLPDGTVPEVGDLIVIENSEHVIKGVKRDPASAMYECEVET